MLNLFLDAKFENETEEDVRKKKVWKKLEVEWGVGVEKEDKGKTLSEI